MTDGIALDLMIWRLKPVSDPVLSPDEAARAARFVFDRDRDRYVAGRSALRRILSRYLDLSPDAVAFTYGPNGRPSVAGLTFNLSHTGDLAALVVAWDEGIALGVDIEAAREIEPGVAEAHFTAGELATLRSLSPSEWRAGFFRCWTRKEAYLKAWGTGLATDLSSFEVTLGPGDAPRLRRCDSGTAAEWILLDFTPADGVAGAIAVRATGRPVRVTRCPAL